MALNEIQVVNELEKYFKSMGFTTERSKYNYYIQKGILAGMYEYVEVDLVIRKNGVEIPIEVKCWWDTDSIHKGIGQALSNLIFYDESWLAVPYIATKLLTQILKTIKLPEFKVFDWQNKVLYEHRDGEVIGNKL